MSDIQTTDWSETAASNTAASPNGFPDNQPPDTVKAIVREVMAALKREYDRSHGTATTGGTTTAYTLTYTSEPPAYTNGLRFSFIVNATNTGSSTLKVGSLPAVTINKQSSAGFVNLAAGDLVIGTHAEVEYDSATPCFVLLSGVGASGGNLPSDLVYNDQTTQWVTHQTNGAVPYTLTDTATLVIDWSLGNSVIVNLPGNRVMGTPLNMVAGGTYQMFLVQGSGGSHLVTSWASAFDFGANGTPTLSTTAGLVDFFAFGCMTAAVMKTVYVGAGFNNS